MNQEQIMEALADHRDWATTNDTPDGAWRLLCYNCNEDLGPYTSDLIGNIFSAHQAAVLAPLIDAAQAEAWEQGRDAEFQRSVMKRQMDDNPYRH